MNPAAPTLPGGDAPRPGKRPVGRRVVLVGALLVVAALWLAREPIRQAVALRLILANPAPNPAALAEVLSQAPDPTAALLAAWESGGIVHRQAALARVPSVFGTDKPWPEAVETMILRAARDPDHDLRRRALGLLRDRKHPACMLAIQAQLRDVDPDLRLLGLQHARYLDAETAATMAVPLLDDPDPTVQALAIKTVERLAGTSFGVRLSDTIPTRTDPNSLPQPRAGAAEKLAQGAAQARAWWAAHRPQRPSMLPDADSFLPPPMFPPAPDFTLPDLDGRPVRLRDFRGRVVLLNFWTTWCTACQEEMPALNALHERLGKEVAILGISLDFVPDEHGDIGGHAHHEETGAEEAAHAGSGEARPTTKAIAAKVRATVRRRGLRYPVLLDEHNEAGGMYQGGELPTTVIIDAQGCVRRRFIGARSPETFAAMIAEARQPVNPSRPQSR
ncbi:MAG: TlpA family protein disulfide reductase [Verrucomicrobia bacterium]|nr:MAG: TlpA family protein disulfide reductase [Verrucomicrobiota bacterium]